MTTRKEFDEAAMLIATDRMRAAISQTQPPRPAVGQMLIQHFVLSQDYLLCVDVEKMQAYSLIFGCMRDLHKNGTFGFHEEES